MAYDVGNPGLGLEYAQTCGAIKSVNIYLSTSLTFRYSGFIVCTIHCMWKHDIETYEVNFIIILNTNDASGKRQP
jgi:hypothetical protein